MIDFDGATFTIFQREQKRNASTVQAASAKKGVGTGSRKASQKTDTSVPAPLPVRVRSRSAHSPSAVINFEYIPSGKIHLNHEEHEHLVDFFE